MAWRDIFDSIQKVKAENVVQEQRMHIPEKIFIEKDGRHWQTSEQEPALLGRINELLGGYYGCQNYIELFYSLPEIFAPIHEIASRVADATWQLKKDWNDQVDYKDSDYNRLFSQPNPIQTHRQLVYEAVVYEILTGKLLQHFNKSSILGDGLDAVITWQNLPSSKTYAKVNRNVDPYTATSIADYASLWWTPDQRGGNRTFDTRNVLPFLNVSMYNRWDINCVDAPIKGAEKAIRNLIPVYEARGVIFIKRGALGFIVSRKSDESGQIALTKAEKAEAQKDFQGTYGLTGGRETVGVTSLPVDFVRTAMSISELQPFDETLADAVAIYKVLRVPRHLVPSKDQSTFSNADADMKAFYDDVIIPWANKYAQAWTNYLKLKDQRRYIYPDYSHIAVLQENRKEKSEVDRTMGDVWEKRWKSGACTLNDWIRSFDGDVVSGAMYDKKIFELSEEELIQLKKFLNLKPNATTSREDTTRESQGNAN